MYLQRLIADPKIGFNYDYMGSAEYEFGVTAEARVAIAKAYLDGDIGAKLTNLIEVHGKNRSNPVQVRVLAKKSTITQIGDEFALPVLKECFRTDNPKIIGWLKVMPHRAPNLDPLIMIRHHLVDGPARIDQFFDPFIQELRDDGYVPAKAA